MTEKESKTDFANRECLSMIREYVASTKEQETYSDKAIMGEYLDCYNVGMDMFNLGHTHTTSSMIETIKKRIEELDRIMQINLAPNSTTLNKLDELNHRIDELNKLLTDLKK